MTILQRIKNLWAWSERVPMWGEYKSSGTYNKISYQPSLEEVMRDMPQEAQIIYPNKREEILRANPEASLDDIAQ